MTTLISITFVQLMALIFLIKYSNKKNYDCYILLGNNYNLVVFL